MIAIQGMDPLLALFLMRAEKFEATPTGLCFVFTDAVGLMPADCRMILETETDGSVEVSAFGPGFNRRANARLGALSEVTYGGVVNWLSTVEWRKRA